MNELQIKTNNNVLVTANEKTMTTKELAQVLGVDVRTVNETVERLLESTFQKVFKNIKTVSTGGRPTKVFTEEQATIIKQEIQKHHNAGLKAVSEGTRQIDCVTTDYEMELMTQKVLAYHAQKAAEYKARMEVAENALNRISDGKGCYGMNQTAKALKLPYGDKTLYKELVRMGILNEDHSPRQEQINAERFKVVVKFINDFVGSKPVTLTTGKGLVYLAKKFNTTIDESILPDNN